MQKEAIPSSGEASFMESIEAYTFGTLLRQLRQQKRLSQTALASRLNLGSRGTIDAWEQDKQRPNNIDRVLDLAGALELLNYQTEDLVAAYFSPIFEASKVYHQAERHDCYPDFRLPVNYIRRTQVLSTVRTALIGDVSGTKQRLTISAKPIALHGMGGAGKSVIARALCDDPVVRAAFPDGILGVTLGKNPNCIAAMRTWINTLGGMISENVPTVDGLQRILMNLLRDRRCLLILDDMWKRTDAEKFLVGGPRCRVLLTTRDSEIAHELGAAIHTIPAMTELEAMRLLEAWADRHLGETTHMLKERIVKRLGYLPLAIKLAGAQLRRKAPNEWLQNFQMHKLKSPRPETIHDDLVLTFEMSLEELDEEARHLYTTLAIFKEGEAIHQAGIEQLWQGLSNFNVDATANLLDDLAARALLDITFSESLPSRTVILHDLLYDLIRIELGDKYIAVHESLLNVYRAICRERGWHTAKDDGYLYDNLTYHLYTVEADEELKGLFANQNWLYVRFTQSDDTYDGYLEDLSLAWRYFIAEAKRQIEADLEPIALADCVRCLLIYTSITSLAASYEPALVGRAVEIGFWTPYRSLRTTATIIDDMRRARMCAALLRTGRLNKEQQWVIQKWGLEVALARKNEDECAELLVALAYQLNGELLTQALAKAQTLTHAKKRAEALVALVPQLAGERRIKVLAQELEVLQALPNERRAEVLEVLAPQLPEELLARCWESALALKNKLRIEGEYYAESYFTKELRVLAPHLTGKLLTQALEATLALKDKQRQSDVLAALAPQLTGDLLERALEAALAIYPWGQVEVLKAMAPQLSGELLARCLQGALKLPREKRAEVLVALAPQLTGELLIQTLKVVKTLPEGDKAWVLVALLPRLAGQQRAQVLEQALKAVHPLKGERYFEGFPHRLLAWKTLVPLLPEEQRSKLLEDELEAALAASVVLDFREPVFGILAPVLEGKQLKRVWEFASHREGHARLLKELIPQLKGELHVQSLKDVLKLPPDERGMVLEALAPHLPEELLQQGMEISTAPTDGAARTRVLAAMFPQLTEKQRAQVLQRMLEVTLECKDNWWEYPLEVLIPELTEEQRAQVLQRTLEDALERRNNWWEYPSALAALAPHLTEVQLELALETTLTLEEKKGRSRALAVLASKLRGNLLERCLETALASSDTENPSVLAQLAPQLAEDRRSSALGYALDLALAENFPLIRLPALIALAPQLTGKMLQRGLDATLVADGYGLSFETLRAQALAAMILRLKEEQQSNALEQALETALTFETEQARVCVLEALAPQLKGELLTRALKATLALKYNRAGRARVLKALVPQLADEQRTQILERGLQTALELYGEERAVTLAAFLPMVTEQASLLKQIRTAMIDYLSSPRYWSRKDVLQRSFPKSLFKPPVLPPELLRTIASSIIEICEEWRWL